MFVSRLRGSASRATARFSRLRNCSSGASSSSTAAAAESAASSTAEAAVPPTNLQLFQQARLAAIPMLGFGFMDNIIMIQAGDYIDTTFGAVLGISTLTAGADKAPKKSPSQPPSKTFSTRPPPASATCAPT